MINLIPIEKKKKITINFYYRLIVVVFFMISASLLVASFVILPSYILSNVKKNITNQKLEAQINEPIPKLDEQTISVLNNLNSKLDLIEKNKDNRYLVSKKVIDEVISRRIPGIKINHIYYENSTTGGRKINVGGIANSREQLLLFRRAFENEAIFKKVDLPISNFVKGSNIEFNLNLTPA